MAHLATPGAIKSVCPGGFVGIHRVEWPDRRRHGQDHRGRRHEGALPRCGCRGDPVLFLRSYGPGTTAWITFRKVVGALSEHFRCI